MSLIPKEEIYVLAAIKGLEILEFSGAATQRLKIAKYVSFPLGRS